MNKLKIMDYEGEYTETDIDLDDLDNILAIEIMVVTGDEIVTAHYNDGSTKHYDSSDCRIRDYLDENYYLYCKEDNINIIEEFNKRTSSYWRW